MEVSCGLSQPNVIHGGEVAACRAAVCMNLSTSLKHSSLHCKLYGDPRLVFRANSPKKLKKKHAYCARANVPKISREGSFWLRYCSCSSSFVYNSSSNNFKSSKHFGLSRCQGNDSVAYINGNEREAEIIENNNCDPASIAPREKLEEAEGGMETPSLDELRELLQKALKDLEIARHNSSMFEEKAQRISEAAIASKDEATNAWSDVNNALSNIQEIINEEAIAKEGVQKATLALSLADARLQVFVSSLKIVKENNGFPKASKESNSENESVGQELSEEEALLAAQQDIQECQDHLANCEAELRRVQNKKDELQKEVDRLNQVAEQAQINASKADEEVANIMLLAEQAVANELEAAQRVDDAEIALQRAEKNLALVSVDSVVSAVEGTVFVEVPEGGSADGDVNKDLDAPLEAAEVLETLPDSQLEEPSLSDESDKESGKVSVDLSNDTESDAEKLKTIQSKVQEMQKESTREGSPFSTPKALLKKSSRFFPASFFSFSADEEEFTPGSVFRGLVESARKQLPKLVFGSLLVGAGYACCFS